MLALQMLGSILANREPVPSAALDPFLLAADGALDAVVCLKLLTAQLKSIEIHVEIA